MNVRKVGPDFHLVELTPEGKALAKGTPLRISNGRISIEFPASGDPVKVARYEWDMLLRDHAHIDGTKLCAILTVPDEEPEDDELSKSDEVKEND